MSSNDNPQPGRTNHLPPRSSRNPIPTVQKYRAYKSQQREDLSNDNADTGPGPEWQGDEDNSYEQAQLEEVHGDIKAGANTQDSPGDVQNWNDVEKYKSEESQSVPADPISEGHDISPLKDTTQLQHSQDPKQYRAQMRKRKSDHIERDVTDPVTHLPVTIRDLTNLELQGVDTSYSEDELENISIETAESDGQAIHQGMKRMFPPPQFELARQALATVYRNAAIFGMGSMLVIGWGTVGVVLSILDNSDQSNWRVARYAAVAVMVVLGMVAAIAMVLCAQHWMEKKLNNVWEEQVWEADPEMKTSVAKAQKPESVQWLNMLVRSVWPLINPALFTSVADMLEDVMQASLPRFVRMVSVEDLGQGSEPIRILGVKQLPKGAAAESISKDSKLRRGSQEHREMSNDPKNANKESLEGEEGEFVNIELAFAYRSTESRGDRDRAKNAHLYMAFYLPGQIKLPVWVELRGLVGTMRARLQLIPDPPFVAKCTFTFLGQPKVDLSCTPLIEKGLNLMDVPLLSNFVQSAVDAGLSQCVAPRSQTMDLQNMLSGDDFKKDTVAKGLLRIKVSRAYDFRQGSAKIPLMSSGMPDAYVSIGWAKFGKPLWSTRVIVDEQQPYWEEVGYLLVRPEELDADESLRIQLWNSDKHIADTDLGRIEVSLKDLMNNQKSSGKNCWRTDSFESMEAGEIVPGRLEWEVGYYSKTSLMRSEIQRNGSDPDIRNEVDLKRKIENLAEQKLRESSKDMSDEKEHQQKQDYKAAAIDMISNSPPSENYPGGILSIQIHQIVGLSYEKRSRTRDIDSTDYDELEGDDALPSSYCTIVLNHRKVYKTRTKPKNRMPFFNTCMERFVRDWRTTSIFVLVRDSRVHEDDPLLGLIYIPLAKALNTREVSYMNDNYPLIGGIGYGRLRVSIVFRSVHMHEHLTDLGWDYGTLEIEPEIQSERLEDNLKSHTLKIRTSAGKAKMRGSPHHNPDGIWKSNKTQTIKLAITKRYATNMSIEFRNSAFIFGDKVSAFAVLWLCNIPDEEWQSIDLAVWKGDLKRAEACILPEEQCGPRAGTLKIRLRFCRGLGIYHKKCASHNPDMQEVLDVLRCAHDNHEIEECVGQADWQIGGGEERETETSGVDDSDDEKDRNQEVNGGEKKGDESVKMRILRGQNGHHEDIAEYERDSKKGMHMEGLADDTKGYLKRSDQVHTTHRGIMQWKAPRTIKWVKNKGQHAAHRLSGVFERHTREPNIETEV